MSNDATRATAEAMPEETRDIGDACDVLCRAIHMNEVLFMAGESQLDKKLANAITTQCDFISDLLEDTKEILYGYLEQRSDARLADMLDAHASAAAALNSHEGGLDNQEVILLLKQLNEVVLSICAYRPLSKAGERRKAEFLRVHLQHNVLSEDEQEALIGSLMPEGGAA